MTDWLHFHVHFHEIQDIMLFSISDIIYGVYSDSNAILTST